MREEFVLCSLLCRSSIVRHRQLLVVVVVVEFAPSTPPNLQAVNLEEGGGIWSALDNEPVLPMDHDPLGMAGVAGNTDEEPVDAHGSRCTRESTHARVDVRESTHLNEGGLPWPVRVQGATAREAE